MKKILCLAIALSTMIATPAFATKDYDIVPSSQKIILDNTEVQAQGYNINGNNYYKLRDVAALLSGKESAFNVSYNTSKKSIDITRFNNYKKLDTDLQISDNKDIKSSKYFQKVYVDNEEVYYDAYFINGNNYFKLRDLGKTIGFFVHYDDEKNTITILSKSKEPEDLVEKVYIKPISFTSDGTYKIQTFKYNEKTQLHPEDFINQMGLATLLCDDGSRYPAKIDYIESNNTFLMTSSIYKIKGKLYFQPYIRVVQGNKTEFFDYSKNLDLTEIFKNFSKDEDLVLNLGYYVGEENTPQNFRLACTINFTK